jgi:hypothetical protein
MSEYKLDTTQFRILLVKVSNSSIKKKIIIWCLFGYRKLNHIETERKPFSRFAIKIV